MPTARSTNGQRATQAPATRARRTNRRQQAPTAYTPGATNRREAKVLDSGARTEQRVIANLASRKHGFDVWRRPGIRVRRTAGEDYMPDAAGYLPELAGIVSECSPDVLDPRPDYNFIIEVKGQSASGSAKHKIETAINDLAHVSDVLGVPAAMILQAPALSEQRIRALKAEGRLHSVVVLTEDEITHAGLTGELQRVAKERRRLMRRLGPAGGYTPTKNPPVFERGLAMRIAKRHHAGARLRHYGAQ